MSDDKIVPTVISLDRVVVTKDHYEEAMVIILNTLDQRIKQHGELSHASSHESLGIITEEYHEFLDEVHANNNDGIFNEAIDIAVAGLFTAASMIAKEE